MNNKRTFFQYVIPSVLSFALSGVYAIVDGFFVGNSIGDAGLPQSTLHIPSRGPAIRRDRNRNGRFSQILHSESSRK